MAESGLVEAVTNDEIQTHLTANAAAAATVLTVESTEQFDPAGGQLSISDRDPVDYLTCDDTTITLAAGLDASADDGEPVTLVLGGQRATAWVAEVSFGEEETVPVPIGFEQRAMWPAGPYDPPVPVTVSADLSRITDSPGRAPVIGGNIISSPLATSFKGASDSFPHSAWQTIGGWFPVKLDRVTYDSGTGRFFVWEDGTYDFRCGVTFDSNSTNQRALRPHYWAVDGSDLGAGRMVKFPSDGFTALETAQIRGMYAGESVSFEAWQNSGVALDVLGNNAFLAPPYSDCTVMWVGPR